MTVPTRPAPSVQPEPVEQMAGGYIRPDRELIPPLEPPPIPAPHITSERAQGRHIFLISTMAMHTQNLQGDPRACLFVTEPDASGDALGSSRVTLTGSALRIPEEELADARAVYLTGYPDSKYWVDFEDFFFYRLNVIDVYYVGGFGVMGWVATSDYSQAKSDPLAEHRKDIMHAHERRPQGCAHPARQKVGRHRSTAGGDDRG